MATDSELEGMLNGLEKIARTILINTKEEMPPTWLVTINSGEFEMIRTPWRNDREKAITKAFMRQTLNEFHATSYGMVMEAWSVFQPSNIDELSVRPSLHPDRIETVMAFATDGFNNKTRTFEMKRNTDGVCIELDPEAPSLLKIPHDETVMTSDFLNLLGGTA